MAPQASAQAETDREIVVTRTIEGPRKLVFDAFTDVDRLGRWWGPKGGDHQHTSIRIPTGRRLGRHDQRAPR